MFAPGAFATIALVVSTTLAMAAAPDPPAEKPVRKPPNLLLVTLDTTRADHLGCYGDGKARTPRLDALAAGGVVCDRAFAVAPMTLPSHASILTGLYPPSHGARDNADFRLADSRTTLAEHLKARGYSTAAVVASVVLAGNLGMDQGFDVYDEPVPRPVPRPGGSGVRYEPILQRGAGEIADAAIARITSLAAGKDTPPFFLWVHFFDPHYDYTPPEPWASAFAGRPYDGEIAYMDAQLGRILDELTRRGLLDETLVAVTADHGESLGEHGELTHGLFVYDATIRVPLILRWPGSVARGKRYDGLVSGVDIAPTLLDLMGLPALAGVEGRSFAAAARGADHERKAGSRDVHREAIYMEAINAERVFGWAPLYALRDERFKYIDAPEPELYDLVADPGERKNLATARGEEASAWERRLRAVRDGFPGADKASQFAMSDEERRNLEALGYVTADTGPAVAAAGTMGTGPAPTGAPGAGTGGAHGADPKRLVQVSNQYQTAKSMISAGDLAGAEALLERILQVDPGNPAALALSGSIRFAEGGRDAGLARIEASARAAPDVFETQWNLANAMHTLGRLPEAVIAWKAAIALQPGSGEARFGLGNTLAAIKDPRGAADAYREAIRAGYDLPLVRAALGVALADAGDAAAAETELRAAVAGDPGLAPAWNRLGVLQDRSGRGDEALVSFTKALDATPDLADALFNRAKVLIARGDAAGGRRDIDRLIEKNPGYAPAFYLKARLLLDAGDRAGAAEALNRLTGMQGVDPRLSGAAREMLRALED